MSKEVNKKQEMRRQCSICGAEIVVVLLPKRHYSGGHYFGKMDLSDDSKGKVEYWECDSCYNTDDAT